MKRIAIFLFFFISFICGNAQKVAVVLSGGGAKGVTHIGVLKALEENGIPIDYIAGTSMGAIIGGLYASGYSPDKMKEIITSEEFTKWVSGKLDPEYTYFFRHPHPTASWINFKFKYDSVLETHLPTNIVSPVRMDFAFLELFSEATAVAQNNFDSLMVPFRCVASDINANSPYILRNGDLNSAIRASMTYPFYFKPIRIDGRLLFDGGMYNNFPSDVVMEDFFPDIIIGSKAAANYSPPNEDDVISQLTSMLMGETKFNLYCDASVLIQPSLMDVNVIDFSHTIAFIDSGYVAAQRMIPQIRKFVLDTVSAATHQQRRQRFNDRKPEMLINSVEVSGLQQGQATYVANAIIGARQKRSKRDSYSGDMHLDQVKSRYFNILGENRLKSAYPTLYYDRVSGKYKFAIEAKYENNIMAEFGGSLSSGSTNEIFLQLQYNYWRKTMLSTRVNGYFGRFYNSAHAAGTIEVAGINPFYFDVSYTYNQFNYYRTNTLFFTDQTPVFLVENENYSRFSLVFPVTYQGRFELGMVAGQDRDNYFQSNVVTQEDKLDKTRFSFFSPYVEIELNTLNRKQYSNEGRRIYAGVQFVTGLEKHFPGTTSPQTGNYSDYHDYFNYKFGFEQYVKIGSWYRPGFTVEMKATTLSGFRNFTSTSLAMPSFKPIYEMSTRYQQVYLPTGYLSVGQRNVFRLNKNLDIRIEGYVMAPFREVGNNEQSEPVFSDLFPSLHHAFSGSIVYNTPIGPLSASLNKYDDGSKLSFFVNLGYIIFNRSALY